MSEEELPHVVEHINSLIGSAFRSANDKRARSQQRALGMSELGSCRRQAGFKVNEYPMSNPPHERTDVFADSREAMIGTMIHDTVLPQIAAMSMTAEIEKRVVLEFDGLPAIPGSADLVDGTTLGDLKGLALDTEIPTPTGWTTMAMLQPGDQVLDRSGKPCNVTAVTGVRNIGCYRVSFKGVGSIVCDEEHIWPAQYGVTGDSTNEVTDRSITELEEAWHNGKSVAMPVAEALDLPDADLPLDPWLFGYWLGNGAKSGSQIICGAEDAEEVAERIQSIGYSVSIYWGKRADGEGIRGGYLNIRGLLSTLRSMGTLGTKDIPPIYLRASREQRLALLQGLMDSDGSWHRKRDRAVFTSTTRALADAVRELATSLGLRAQWADVVRTGFDKTVMSYDVHFSAYHDIVPFRLKRKASLVVAPTRNNLHHNVIDIERIPSVPTKCIAVDSPDHTFLAGRAMVPTHNCLVPETPILRSDGRLARAEDIRAGDRVVAWDIIYRRLTHAEVASVTENGDQPTVEILTESGRIIRVTEDHPLWLCDDEDSSPRWAKASTVGPGEYLHVALGAPIESPNLQPEPGPDDAWLLGLLAAEPFTPETAQDITDEGTRAVAMTSLSLATEDEVTALWKDNPWIGGIPIIPDSAILSGPRAWKEWLSGYSAGGLEMDLRSAWWKTPNREFADQMAAMLAGLGIKAVENEDGTFVKVEGDYALGRLRSALWLRGSLSSRVAALVDEETSRPDHYDLDMIVHVLTHPEPTRTLAIEVAEHHTFVTGGLITHNTVGHNAAMNYQTRGASKRHLWQTHGYAQALINAGHPIENIALFYLDRSNGQIIHTHYQPFDPGIVDDIEMWWTEVNAVDNPFDLPRDGRGPGDRACDWCCAPGTKVMLPDFTWRNIEDVKVGDVIMGRAEPAGGKKHGVLQPTTVTMVRSRVAPRVRVNGDLIVAEDKKFWHKSKWVSAGKMVGKDAQFIAAPPKRDQAMYERGWLAGMAQGDGTFWTTGAHGTTNRYRGFRLAIGIDSDEILGRFTEYAERAGFGVRPARHPHTSFNGVKSVLPAVKMRTNADTRRFEEWILEDVDDESWTWGYLGGIADAEGSVTSPDGTIRIAQFKPDVYRRIGDALRRAGFDAVAEFNGWRIRSSKGELWRFLAGATPVRPRFTGMAIGRSPYHKTLIHEVTPEGDGEVISLTTDTGTYVAEGFVVHNCPWLTACWGAGATEESAARAIVADASDPTGEIVKHLETYNAAAVLEKQAKIDKAQARDVLAQVEPGQYGEFSLGWKAEAVYTVLDTEAAVKLLEDAGLPVPKVERRNRPAIDVRRTSNISTTRKPTARKPKS